MQSKLNTVYVQSLFVSRYTYFENNIHNIDSNLNNNLKRIIVIADEMSERVKISEY